MALEKWEGRFRSSSNLTVDVTETGGGGASVSNLVILDADTDYYWGSLNAIADTFASVLNASALNATYTVTVDDNADTGTGKLTIAASGASVTAFALTFDQAVFQNLCGYTSASMSGALSYLSQEAVEYLWMPNSGRVNPMAPTPTSSNHSMGAEEADFTYALAPGGQAKSLAYQRRFVDSMEYSLLKGSKVWIQHESSVNESLQKFYRDVISLGYPLRFYPDRSSDSEFFTMRVSNAENFKPTPVNPGWTGSASLWSIAYEIRKNV